MMRHADTALIRPSGTFSHRFATGEGTAVKVPFSRPQDGRRWPKAG